MSGLLFVGMVYSYVQQVQHTSNKLNTRSQDKCGSVLFVNLVIVSIKLERLSSTNEWQEAQLMSTNPAWRG